MRKFAAGVASSLAAIVSGCAQAPVPTAPPPDVELAQAVAAGESAYGRGALPEAAALYRRALARARAMDDAAAIAEAAYNAAACLVAAGDYAAAIPLLDEALHEAKRAGGNTADVLLVQAKVARYQGRTDDALSLGEAVLAVPVASLTDGHRLQVHLIRGQIACAAGDVTAATSDLESARRLLRAKDEPPAVRAAVADLEGAVELKKGNAVDAVGFYDKAAELCREARMYREMMRALARGAGAARAAGNSTAAADRYYRAARGAIAQRDPAGAGWLTQARAAAQAGGDRDLIARIDALAAEAGSPVPASTQPSVRRAEEP